MGFNLRSGRLVPTSRASAGPWPGWAAVAAVEPATSDSVDRGPPRQQYLPEKYNTQSELTLTIEPGSGPITEDFVLIP